jgi:hypothetical protein
VLLKVVKNQYILITAKGPLSGSYSALQLNPVEAPDQSLVPYSWPPATKKLSLTKAVQLANNRGTIAAAQKAARLINILATGALEKRQQGCKRKEPEPEPEPEHVALRVSIRKRRKRTLE